MMNLFLFILLLVIIYAIFVAAKTPLDVYDSIGENAMHSYNSVRDAQQSRNEQKENENLY